MRRGSSLRVRLAFAAAVPLLWGPAQAVPCDKPVYLTFDTGHMGVAPLIGDVLQRQDVTAAFFLANEPTLDGGSSLDDQWAPWWRQMAGRGYVFGSHTYDHVVWRADAGPGHFRMKPTAGPEKGITRDWTAAQYCDELQRVDTRFFTMTGQHLAPIFRAPSGRTSAALLDAAAACGFHHVGWAAAGFLGDELPSDRYPNAVLLARALRDVRAGDILMAHLGIRSRQEVWAPAVLEPLISGLKQRGYCFASLRDHPRYRDLLDAPAGR